MPSVRTRFAPSPTGFLHMGSARTALFNWAFARRHAGRLVLRIDDTDRERSTRESEAELIEALTWLGIDWDEGPLRQSERKGEYAEASDALLSKGRAYRCRCTPEEIAERRRQTLEAGGKWTYDGRCRDLELGPDCGPHTVRLRLPAEGWIAWDDLVFGDSGQDAREIGDKIIRRSDGEPLYNLAVVVDDLAMGITHVIRGSDHVANTPLQIAIYRALEREPPLFAHVPLIVGSGGKKLSKRRDPVSVQSYREEGYLPHATCNWLARLGWSHGDQEVFSRAEIASLFDLGSVHRASAQADPAKLLWLNQHYIKTLPRDELVAQLLPFLENVTQRAVKSTPELEQLVDLLRDRSKTLLDMARFARFLVVDEIAYDDRAARKHLKREMERPLADLHDRLAGLGEWSEAAIESTFHEVRARHGDLSVGKIAQPVRVAITGTDASPGIFETLAVLGQRRSVSRLAEAIHFLRHG